MTSNFGRRSSCHRFGRRGTALTGILIGSLCWTAGAAPAGAATSSSLTPQLMITASTSTNVGLQVFANVNLTGGASPTGTVTFKVFGPSDTACSSALFSSTVPVTGISMNSDRYTTTTSGTYRWVATYSGDANNAAAGPTLCSSPSAAVIASPVSVGLTVNALVPDGGTVRAVAGVGGFAPTGTVTFYLTPPGDTFCSGTPVFTSTAAVNGAGSYSSTAYEALVIGTYKWRAVYSGDRNNLASGFTACLDPSAAVTVPALGVPPTPADRSVFLYPVDGQANVETAKPFTWSTMPQSQGFYVVVGTTNGGYDLVNSGVLPPSQSTLAVPHLPAGPLYATLYTEIGGSWAKNQVSRFSAVADMGAMTYPTSGQTGVDSARPFTWSTVPQAQAYYVEIGTTSGGHDLMNSGVLPPGQSSVAAPPLPAGPLYATVYTVVGGSWARYQVISFTAAPTAAGLTSPLSGQAGVDPAAPITWSTVAGAPYYLYIGTTDGGYDVVNSGVMPGTQFSYTTSGLPAHSTLYAWMCTAVGGAWTAQRITFTTR